jgi:hypothetical protein
MSDHDGAAALVSGKLSTVARLSMRMPACSPSGILQVVYSYRHGRSCLCAECVAGDDKSLDRALDASVARLSASMSAPELPPEVTSLGDLERAAGKAPWEMSASEFDASAALRIVPVWTPDAARLERLHQTPNRTLGLKRSYLRSGTELWLDVEWGPPDGYVVLVSHDEESTLSDPRRAFVKAALDKGIRVAPEILDAYPDLQR